MEKRGIQNFFRNRVSHILSRVPVPHSVRLILNIKSHPLRLVFKYLLLLSLAVPFLGLLFFLSVSVFEMLNFWLFVITYFIFFLGLFVTSYIHWRVNSDLVTEDQIFTVRFHGLFHYTVEEVFLEKVKSFDLFQDGFWQHVFGFGNICISTSFSQSGGRQDVVLKNVWHARKVLKILDGLLSNVRVKSKH